MYCCITFNTVVTMYLGVEEPRAAMPTWAKWIVLCFGGWRLLADIFQTSANCCSGKSCICLCIEYAGCLKAAKSIARKIISLLAGRNFFDNDVINQSNSLYDIRTYESHSDETCVWAMSISTPCSNLYSDRHPSQGFSRLKLQNLSPLRIFVEHTN